MKVHLKLVGFSTRIIYDVESASPYQNGKYFVIKTTSSYLYVQTKVIETIEIIFGK